MLAATRPAFAGRVTRAAVFSALAGCWTGTPPAESTTTTVEHHDKRPPDPAPAAGTIEGTVTDSNTGNPVAYATVEVVGTNQQVTTDAQGHYQIAGLSNGEYTLVFTVRPANPRWTPPRSELKVVVHDQGAHGDVSLAIPQYPHNNSNIPMPYGAPPARRRVV